MDIEHLNKTQIVLLTLLVSFVTSIATGIATVSLIEKAPADVTRVISRIVERPIETMLPGEKQIITETVVVQESDLIADAITTIRPSMVRIHDGDTFLGFGVFADAQGKVFADSAALREKRTYTVTREDGTQFEATASSASSGFGVLMPSAPLATAAKPITQANASALSLGQTVVALGGSATSYAVAPGIISEFLGGSENAGRVFVRTTVTSNALVAGSPLMTMTGEFIGLAYPTEAGLFRLVTATATEA